MVAAVAAGDAVDDALAKSSSDARSSVVYLPPLPDDGYCAVVVAAGDGDEDAPFADCSKSSDSLL